MMTMSMLMMIMIMKMLLMMMMMMTERLLPNEQAHFPGFHLGLSKHHGWFLLFLSFYIVKNWKLMFIIMTERIISWSQQTPW